MSKPIRVSVFEWRPGENDAQYIRLLREELAAQQALTEKAISKLKKLSRESRPVVHSVWVREPDRRNHWHCRECGFVSGLPCRWFRFCPNCSASMDNVDEIKPETEEMGN